MLRAAFAISLIAVSLPTRSQEKLDPYGDPLPGGADVRLGTTRFRFAPNTYIHGGSSVIEFADNQTLVSMHDRSLRYWKAETGQLLREQSLAEERISSMRFSPDRKRLITRARLLQPTKLPEPHWYRTRFWNPATGELLSTLSGNAPLRDPQFTSDGKTFITYLRDSVQFWEISSGERLLDYDLGLGESISHLAVFSEEDERLVITTPHTVYLWNWIDAAKPEVLTRYQERIQAIVRSPTQSVLAISVESLPGIQLWDLEERKLVRQLEFPDDRQLKTIRLRMTSGGETLIALRDNDPGAGKSDLIVWDLATGHVKRMLPLHNSSIYLTYPAVSPDGKRLAVVRNEVITVWDLESGKLLTEDLIAHQANVNSVVFGADDRIVVTAGGDATVRVWDAETGRQLHCLPHQPGDGICAAVVSPDGTRIASLGKELKIWDALTGNVIHQLPGHGDRESGLALAFTADGRRLASFGSDFKLRFCDVETGQKVAEHSLQPDRAATDASGTERSGGEERIPIQEVEGSAFTPHAERLVLGCFPAFCIFDANTGQQLGDFPDPDPLSEAVDYSSYAVSPDGTRLLESDFRNTEIGEGNRRETQLENVVNLHELPSGRELWSQSFPYSVVFGPVAFSADGRLMAAGLLEPLHEIRVWEVATQKQLLVIEDVPGITSGKTLAFSSDNRRLACAQLDHSVLIWNLLEEGLPDSLIAKPEPQDEEERDFP